MKIKTLLLIPIFLLVFSISNAGTFIYLAEEIKLPVPDGWNLSDSTGDYPFQIINEQQSGELLIFKSIISEDEIITNQDDLKISVDKVVEDVILTLPEAKLLTNTGYFDDNRVSFILEFISTDTVSQAPINHRLKGVIYLHPDGYQLLFTLWGKTNEASKALLKQDLSFMMNEFAYYGEAEPKIFQEKSDYTLEYGLVIIVVVILILVFFKRVSSLNKIKYSEESHFWRCQCGRQNHKNHTTCRRCGQAAPV